MISGNSRPTNSAGQADQAAEPVTYRAILTPNRSLSPAGFVVLMTAISLVSFAVGVAFWSIGAWPVMGFLGLDVVLIYWAFRANYRAGRAFETVEVAPDTLVVTRCSAKGETERFSFQTYWVRIMLDEAPSGHTKLRLVSHGRSFLFAQFLSDNERREFADVLENEIRAALRA